MLGFLVLASLVALGSCNANYTVTSEVTFEVEVKNYNGQGDDLSGNVVIGLFGDTVPVAALNFKSLCTGFKVPNKMKMTYKNTHCHRMVKDMLIQCGDVFHRDGTGSASIYGQYFNDENFVVSHSSAGIISMANKGRDTNGSQFFFTLGSVRFFDKKHVAFGKVLKGMQYLAAINKVGGNAKNQKPLRPIKITDCSAETVKKYELSEKDMKTHDLEGVVTF